MCLVICNQDVCPCTSLYFPPSRSSSMAGGAPVLFQRSISSPLSAAAVVPSRRSTCSSFSKPRQSNRDSIISSMLVIVQNRRICKGTADPADCALKSRAMHADPTPSSAPAIVHNSRSCAGTTHRSACNILETNQSIILVRMRDSRTAGPTTGWYKHVDFFLHAKALHQPCFHSHREWERERERDREREKVKNIDIYTEQKIYLK